jgi:hypothetical protein
MVIKFLVSYKISLLVWGHEKCDITSRLFFFFWYCYDGVRLCLCGTGPLTGPLCIPRRYMSEYGAAVE